MPSVFAAMLSSFIGVQLSCALTLSPISAHRNSYLFARDLIRALDISSSRERAGSSQLCDILCSHDSVASVAEWRC
uniref:Secreted protein n=1 Tax=Parascaris univalens TaxID=6257 RepID=A0A915A823_PARUN